MPIPTRPLALIAGLLTGVLFLHYAFEDISPIPRNILPSLLISSTCDPYSQPGYLRYSKQDPHQNRWITFSPSCSSPALLASFARASWLSSPPTNASALSTYAADDWVSAEVGPDGQAWDDAEWARGKTVVLMGDSVLRMASSYFCEMLGEKLTVLGWDHPFSPSPPPPTTDVSQEDAFTPRSDPEPGTTMPAFEPSKAARMGHHAHFCYVPGLDFLLIDAFNFGLDEFGFWTYRESDRPYLFENRIELAGEYIRRAKIAAGRKSTAPEMVYVSSALWDSARFMNEDLESKVSFTEELETERIDWYHNRVQDALVKAREVFPGSKLKWLTATWPIGVMSGWFTEGKRTKNSLIRLEELSNAALAAVNSPMLKKTNAGIARWGQLLIGEENHQVDDLHPEMLPGGYLFADMLLWDLKHA